MDIPQVEARARELLVAHLDGDQVEERRLLVLLLAGEQRDMVRVTAALLAPIARALVLQPGEDFFAPRVTVTEADGTVRAGSLTEMPPARRTAVQMLFAVANRDPAMVTDLWCGYVAGHSCRAWLLLSAALSMSSQHLVQPRGGLS